MIFSNLVEDNEEYDFNPFPLRGLPLSTAWQRENTSRTAIGLMLVQNTNPLALRALPLSAAQQRENTTALRAVVPCEQLCFTAVAPRAPREVMLL